MLWGDWRVCTFETLCLPLAKGVFSKTYPSFLTLKEGSTFLTKPLFPQGREDVTALRCSEPLRYKVGGASKPSPCCAGWDRMGKGGGKGDKFGMLLKPYNKYRAVSYELDAYERRKIRIKDITYGHIYKNTSFVNF